MKRLKKKTKPGLHRGNILNPLMLDRGRLAQTRRHIDRADVLGCCKALVGRDDKVRISLGSKRQSQRSGAEWEGQSLHHLQARARWGCRSRYLQPLGGRERESEPLDSWRMSQEVLPFGARPPRGLNPALSQV